MLPAAISITVVQHFGAVPLVLSTSDGRNHQVWPTAESAVANRLAGAILVNIGSVCVTIGSFRWKSNVCPGF